LHITFLRQAEFAGRRPLGPASSKFKEEAALKRKVTDMNQNIDQIQNKQRKNQVLVVDDHAVVREGLAMLINSEDDLEVCASAENAEQALEEITKGNVDVAVVDISLDGMSGLQLTELIKTRNPHLPVLILTMHDEELYAKRAFRAGAKGFVTKHEASETVITAIRMMLAGRDYISDSITQKFLRKLHSPENNS